MGPPVLPCGGAMLPGWPRWQGAWLGRCAVGTGKSRQRVVTLRIRGPRGNAGDEEATGHRESALGSAVCPGVPISKDSTLRTRANDDASEHRSRYSLWDLTSHPGNEEPLLPDPCQDTQAWLGSWNPAKDVVSARRRCPHTAQPPSGRRQTGA